MKARPTEPGFALLRIGGIARSVELAQQIRMGGCTAHLHQLHFQGFEDGTESGAASLAAVDTDFSIDVDTIFALRFEIEESNNCSSMNNQFHLQHNINGAGFVTTTTATSGVRLANGATTDGEATTDRIAGSAKTFVAGEVDEEGATANITLQNQHTEMLFVLELVGADLNDQDTIIFRVDTGGIQLDEYHVTPTVTANKVAGGVTVTPGTGVLTATGFAPSVLLPVVAAAALGVLTLTGFAPTVSVTENVTVSPGTGQVTATGFAPTVQTGAGITVEPGTGALTLSGFAPTVTASDHQIVLPGVGALTATGFAPDATVSDNQTVTPGTGVATLTGFAPTATASDHKTVTPGVGVLTLTGFAPGVQGGSGLTITPGVGVLSATGFAPEVSATQHVTVTPGVGALIATGFAPTAGASVQVTPGVGLLVLTGFAPIVSTPPPPARPARRSRGGRDHPARSGTHPARGGGRAHTR